MNDKARTVSRLRPKLFAATVLSSAIPFAGGAIRAADDPIVRGSVEQIHIIRAMPVRKCHHPRPG